MGKLRDLTGKRFGMLLVLGKAGSNKWRATYWHCRCECGQETQVFSHSLLRGKTRSCGCQQGKKDGEFAGLKHGHYVKGERTPTYGSWRAMWERCTNPDSTSYAYYGGRGITVCSRWASFTNFLADMDERPDGMTLDRINPEGDYEPTNCRWATPKEQRNNRRARKSVSLVN